MNFELVLILLIIAVIVLGVWTGILTINHVAAKKLADEAQATADRALAKAKEVANKAGL